MANQSEQSRIERVLALLFAVLMITAVFAPAVGATVTAGNDTAGDAVDAPQNDTAQTDDQSPSSQAEDETTVDNETESEATADDATRNATGTIEVIVRVEEFDVPSASTLSQDAVVDELKAHAEESQQPIVDWAQSTEGVEVRNDYWLANALLLELDTNQVDVRELVAQPGVTDVHANFVVETPEPVERDDASDDDYDTTYGLDQINATEVWDAYGTKGAGTSVAVLDTGVDPDHPDIDLDEENWAEFNDDGDEVDSDPYDSDEHGTHTSGTVSGGDASGEYIGVAPEVELMHGKVLDGGSGSFAAIIGGMEWAVEQDADVTSMSLGASGEYIPDFIEPVQNAEQAGTIVVSSSGNSGEDTSGSPANVYESFAIGASDIDGDIASFSSGEIVDTQDAWGSNAPDDWPDSYVVPDVAAPGVNVKSSVPGGGYDNTFSGTSMAAPHVSGAIALMLSASDDDPSIDTIKSSLEETAWKPAGAPDQKDTRYGEGIIDAKLATDRIAAESGVTGTVTDADGNPIEGATVALDTGYTVETDENGEYTLRGQEAQFDISVEAFGYADESVSVDVPDGSFVTEDITLQDELAVEVLDEQPDTVQSGETASMTVDAANVDQLTVELSGDYPQEDASLFVDGDAVNFGDAYEFDGSDRSEVTVAVETTAGVTGNVSLEHTYEGLGDDESITTGPTSVFNEEIQVGVVDTPDAEYDTLLANDLEDVLPARYNVSLVSTDEMMDVVDEYDTFVVHRLGDDHQRTSDFVDATEDSDTGVVYLDQYGKDWSTSLLDLSRATGNPGWTDEMYAVTDQPVVFETRADHPIFDGVAEPGDSIELYNVGTGDHTWFGDFNGQVLADVGWKGHEMSGQGLAVDDLRQSVYASALGRTLLIGNFYDYTEQADQVLANSVEHVSSDSPVSVRSDQPEQASPGESISAEFDVTDLEQIEVGLNEDESTLTEDDLTLYVDGNVASFDQALAYDDVTSENFTVTVEPETDAVGSVSLEHEFVAGDDERITGNTGPTAMYDSPLEVPEDVDTVQEAVDLATTGGEIVLENGTYTEQVSINADGKRNLTIRSADGADATIEAPEDVTEKSTPVTTGIRPTVMVHNDDNVTIEGLTIDAGGNNEGVVVTDSSNFTAANLTVTNARQGVRADYLAKDTHVKNVTVTNADTGIMIYWLSDRGLIENSTTTNTTVGLQPGYMSDETDVINNDVTDAETGIVVTSDYGDVVDNTITDTSTAIDVRLSGAPDRIENNEIVNATVGIPMRQKLSLADTDVTRNTVDAETGIRLYGATTQPGITYNDLSESSQPFDLPTHTPYDVRQNYLGDRSAEDAIGPSNAVYQPFLTESPSDLDEGPEATTEIATDLHLEGGETYGVGVPGPSETTIDEMFEDDFEGAVYGFDADTQSWTMLTGDDTVDSLNAMVVVAETDTRLTLDFQSPENAPPAPGSYQLTEGWNFVTAPAYTDADDAYGNYVSDGEPVISTFDAPEGQLGTAGELDGTYMLGSGDAPTLSAFEGYFVFSSEDGEKMPTRFAADPTADEMYESLDADDQFAAGATEATSAEALFERADETDGEIAEERLTQVVYGQFERALSNADDPRTALSSTAAEIVAEADAEHVGLLETAMDDALQQILADEFSGEPEEDAMEDVVRQILADEFPDESAEDSDANRDSESDATASESVTAPTALAV